MARKDKKVPNESPMKYFYPAFNLDPFQNAALKIEDVICGSGLPFNMEYRPDDGYFSVELYNKK